MSVFAVNVCIQFSRTEFWRIPASRSDSALGRPDVARTRFYVAITAVLHVFSPIVRLSSLVHTCSLKFPERNSVIRITGDEINGHRRWRPENRSRAASDRPGTIRAELLIKFQTSGPEKARRALINILQVGKKLRGPKQSTCYIITDNRAAF